MAWSRIDSGFWRHPKFTGWTAAQKWALGELIGYCCEYRTDGHVPDDLSLLPRSVTKGFLTLATDAGWLDEDEGGLRFHDWNDYHPADPTAADRMKRHRRNKERNGTVTEPVTTNTSTNTSKKDHSKAVARATYLRVELPFEIEQAVVRLMIHIDDHADAETESVIRSYARRLHLSSLAKALESSQKARPDNRAAYVVGVLKSELDERSTGVPTEAA